MVGGFGGCLSAFRVHGKGRFMTLCSWALAPVLGRAALGLLGRLSWAVSRRLWRSQFKVHIHFMYDNIVNYAERYSLPIALVTVLLSLLYLA